MPEIAGAHAVADEHREWPTAARWLSGKASLYETADAWKACSTPGPSADQFFTKSRVPKAGLCLAVCDLRHDHILSRLPLAGRVPLEAMPCAEAVEDA